MWSVWCVCVFVCVLVYFGSFKSLLNYSHCVCVLPYTCKHSRDVRVPTYFVPFTPLGVPRASGGQDRESREEDPVRTRYEHNSPKPRETTDARRDVGRGWIGLVHVVRVPSVRRSFPLLVFPSLTFLHFLPPSSLGLGYDRGFGGPTSWVDTSVSDWCRRRMSVLVVEGPRVLLTDLWDTTVSTTTLPVSGVFQGVRDRHYGTFRYTVLVVGLVT